MHLGIVHDDGPDQMGQMEKLSRYGKIYTFLHPGNGEENDNPLVEFENGTKGIANRKYLRYDLVALDDDDEEEKGENQSKTSHPNLGNICGKIINPNDPSNPNFKIIQDGLVCYYKWAGEEIAKLLS
ncbi:MAG TPA: hypothetical protein VGA21_10740 [Cyclobacteriaceae bacterium]